MLPHACSDMLLAAWMMNRQLTIKFRRASLANVEEQSDAPCNVVHCTKLDNQALWEFACHCFRDVQCTMYKFQILWKPGLSIKGLCYWICWSLFPLEPECLQVGTFFFVVGMHLLLDRWLATAMLPEPRAHLWPNSEGCRLPMLKSNLTMESQRFSEDSWN